MVWVDSYRLSLAVSLLSCLVTDASLALGGGLSSDPARCPVDWCMGVGKGGSRRLSPAVATKLNYM